MWLLRIKETRGVKVKLCRNGREYRLIELLRYSVDGYCPETKIVYEFLGCYFHGHTSQPFRYVTNLRGDTVAERDSRK